jgi:mRNA-binding protein PUF3
MQYADSAQQARSTRFPEFGTATGRHNSDDRSSQSSTLGQTFGNGGAWQASSDIWGSNTIGSGFTNTKRDASRSRGRLAPQHEACAVTDFYIATGNDEFLDGPSGSGALAASSEADPWGARANGPWNPPDTTSPTLQSSHSGSTSPSHTRNSLPNSSSQTLLEIQNSYQRPAIGQGVGFSRSQPKSNLDPSSGSFTFVRKPSSGNFGNDDKENSGHYYSNLEAFEVEIPSRFLGIGNSASRDVSTPASRASDPVPNGASLGFGHGSSQPFGSIGHTPSSSIHSQRPSFSGAPGSFPSQSTGTRYGLQQNELELSEKFASLGLSREAEQINASQIQNNHSFAQNYQAGGESGMWNNSPKAFNSYEPYSNQPFADQGYFNKAPRFGDRGSVSPAGSDYRRGLNSPKYYSNAGTPPAGSDQIYRPGSRGPRVPQGPSELDRRLQSIHFAQQAYMYGGHFQGQYPHAYDYPPQAFRQGYGYPMPMPPYPAAQVVPTRPAKDQDVGVGVRSVLLEEFRSNSKSNKRYELKVNLHEISSDTHLLTSL